MKFDEVRAIDLKPYQLALVHAITGTDERRTRNIILRAACTPSGAGRIVYARLRSNEWKRKTFGPGVIRPAHSFFVVVLDRATGNQVGRLADDSDDILLEARDAVWTALNPERAAQIADPALTRR